MRRARASLSYSYLTFAALAAIAAALLAAARVSPVVIGALVAAALLAAAWLLSRRGPAARLAATELDGADLWRDVMPCYLSAQDRELRLIETNELFRKTFGQRIGERCYRVYKQRDSPCADCPVLKTFADGKTHTSQEQVITETGELADFIVTSAPLRDRAGRVVAVAEMSTNVSELKSLQRQLDQQRSYFKQLFDLVPCYISIQDRDLGIVEANEAFRRDFGDPAAQRCFAAYKGREAPCPDCPVEKTFADGTVHTSQETVVLRDGREASVLVHSAPIRSAPDGRISKVMEVSTNITEVKRLQRELAMMGLAIAGMAHRVKNILMGLEGGIFVVNTGFELDEPQTVREGWGMVERNVAKISRIVKDLLYCSRERAPHFVDNVSPARLVREVFELFRARTRTDQIELSLEVDDPPHHGTFDPEALTNLLTNLLANAVDACRFDDNAEKQQHTIRLRCRQHGASTIFEVADDGPGIPDDVHHRVFENFFSTKGSEGTGLGLLVVQKVAAEHGGSVSFTSELGCGTTFRVVLPHSPPR